MRSNLELWEIVRDNFDEYFIFGLCGLIMNLQKLKIITISEKYILNKELNNSVEKNYGYFLGESGDPKPRKEFIEKMIKKHKNIL